MTSFTRIFSSIKSAYNNINPSTLTGAIDTIVVQQEDGTLRCTPFHVRFGKLGVLQNQQNKVYITINGNSVEDLYMELGEAGEALFIEEATAATMPPTRHLEPSDSNTFLDPDNALSLNSNPQLSNIDCSPQIINKQIDRQNSHENHQSTPKYAYEQPIVSSVDVDVLNSNTTISNSRRRQKRRAMTSISKQSSEEDDQEIEKIFSSIKRRSRTRQRDSTPTSLHENLSGEDTSEQADSPLKLLRKRSASENDLQFFPIDDEKHSESSTPFVDAHSRINSIDSRKKLLIIPPRVTFESDHDGEDESDSSSPEDSIRENGINQRTTRTLSNPIPIEQKPKENEDEEESNTLINTIFSRSAPLGNLSSTIPIRISQSNAVNSYYLNENFSPTSAFESPISLRPTSPKSDTEYELDKSSQQSAIKKHTILGWQWKWGEFPEQRRSVFRYLWPSSSKETTPKEGIYLDDITNNKCNDRSRYLPQIDLQQKSINDDDQESGTGNSIPNSPVRDHENSCLLGDVQLSLCGNLNKQSPITDEIFNAHLISYEKFVNNPTIIHDPNLIARIGGKYYNWNVASALIASTSVYHKQLPVETIEELQEKQMTPTKSRMTSSSSWWPFSGKKVDATNDSVRSEALAQVAKSEVAETILKNQNFIRNNSHDSEQDDDNEVKTLTNKIKQQTSSTLKKTMILTSDQLKRLNLKSGMNQVEFSVTTALQGTTVVEANIFFFDHLTKFVISDIDGTITKSDVFGHILPLVGKDWSHDGIAEFFQAIQENGYQFIYLSARAIGQSRITRNFMKNIKQCGCALPNGPLLISPDTLVTALYREVIAKKPEDFKIECLKNIASLFPDKNPFYAGFGNRINDQWAYTAVGIPMTRIFTINPRGEVVRQKLSQVLSTSYKNLHEVVDQVFPPMDSFSASESYSSFTFWRDEPNGDSFENEMRTHLEEMSKRQKTKGKGSTGTPATGALSKTTPTTTVIKSGGEKMLTLAQATENTVKKP
jgi:phosphatidate phosphatase LPIN